MSKTNVFISAIIGSFIGALLGVLFAPEKGEKTRETIAKKSDEYAESVRAEFDELIKNLKERFDSVVGEEDLLEKGNKKATNLKNKAEELKDEASS